MVSSSPSNFRQWKTLCRKNALLCVRRKRQTLFVCLSPILIIVLLLLMQKASDFVLDKNDKHPQATSVDYVPQCSSTQGQCKTIVYAPADVPWVNNVMLWIAEKNGLIIGQDIVPLPNTSSVPVSNWCSDVDTPATPPCIQDGCLPCRLLADQDTMDSYLDERQNLTQSAVLFTSAYFPFPGQRGANPPKGSGYELYYNDTSFLATPLTLTHFQKFTINTKRAIDEAILGVGRKLSQDSAEMTYELSWANFPVGPERYAGFDIAASNGGVWFFVPPMVVFFVFLNDIVDEKERGLWVSLRMVGVGPGLYFLSWHFSTLCFSAAMTTIMLAVGALAQMEVFLNANVAVLFLIFFLTTWATATLALYVSTFLQSTNQAQSVGYFFVLMAFVLLQILSGGYGALINLILTDSSPLTQAVRPLFLLYPPFHFSKAYYDVSMLSCSTFNRTSENVVKGRGYHWSDLFEWRHDENVFGPVDIPPTIHAIEYLVVDLVLYLVLAMFGSTLLAKLKEAMRKLRFTGRQPSTASIELAEDIKKEKDKVLAAGTDSAISTAAPVRLVGLTKVFGGDKSLTKRLWLRLKRLWTRSPPETIAPAVDQMYLNLYEGQIFCLLGHNGAGKTTAINMLTGLLPPTAGDAIVFGHSVTGDPESVQASLGFCQQQDSLWDELSCDEHLQLFAALKGTASSEVPDQVSTQLRFVDLQSAQSKQARALSGGMKRRLSLAIAMLGDPKVVILDEPTAGMDPVNRRRAWEMIERLKADRIVVLTTHHMKEADYLADRIGMMASGTLQCIGNGLDLKKRFGRGYQLEIHPPQEMISECTEELQQRFAEAEITRNAEHLNVRLPLATPEAKVRELVQWIEGEGAGIVGSDWGISFSTLESAFFEVTDRGGYHLEHQSSSSHTNPPSGNYPHGSASYIAIRDEQQEHPHEHMSEWPQYRAIFSKNLSVQSKQRAQNWRQISYPASVMLLLLFLQNLVQQAFGPGQDVEIPAIRYPLNLNLLAPSPPGSGNCLEFFEVTAAEGVDVGYLNASGRGEGLLGHVTQKQCALYNSSTIQAPYFEARKSLEEAQEAVYNTMKILKDIPVSSLDNEPFPSYLLPDGLLHFHNLSSEKGILNFSFSINDANYMRYHRPNNFTRFRTSTGGFDTDQLVIQQARLGFMDMIYKAFKQISLKPTKNNVTSTGILDSLLDMTIVTSMPIDQVIVPADIVSLAGAFFFPIAFTIQFPVYLFILVMEKEKKLLALQQTMGMSMRAYWAVNYLLYMALYLLMVAFFWIVGYWGGFRFFMQTHALILSLFFVGWGNALIISAFVISTLLKTQRGALITGYLVTALGSGISLVITDFIYGFQTGAQEMPYILLLVPMFGLTRGFYVMNWSCAVNLRCFDVLSMIHPGTEMYNIICSFILIPLALLPLLWHRSGIMPEASVKPSSRNLRGSQTRPFKSVFKEKVQTGELGDDEAGSSKALLGEELEDREEMSLGTVDEDVKREEEFALDTIPDRVADHPLVVHGLRKVFEDGKVAVANLSLVIKKQEIFGLLGENGAGKTTAINLITRQYQLDAGQGWIAGHPITESTRSIRQHIGYCPQHDVLWDELTPREHLLYYARIKGCTLGDGQVETSRLLEGIGLTDHQHKPAGQLSGGMRRRLSIGISMAGSSKLVILDEPTTGLDPVTRRQIWRIILRTREFTKDRAIILTTHSMDEAEILCDRVAIMSNGHVKALGAPRHLRKKYGIGYKVLINFDGKHEEHILDMLRNFLPPFKLSPQVQAELRQAQLQWGSLDFAISHSDLEDVFQSVCEA